MALNVATEAALAGAYPAVHLGKREQKIVKILKTYIDAGDGPGSVTLADLASGIAPSHVVKFAGTFTTAGGDASESITVTGAAATDIVMVSVKTAGATPRSIVAAAAGTNAIAVTMSGDPSTDHVLQYLVLRAAA